MIFRDESHDEQQTADPSNGNAHSTVRRELIESVVVRIDEALQRGEEPPAEVTATLTSAEQQELSEFTDCLRMLDAARRDRQSQPDPNGLVAWPDRSSVSSAGNWNSRRGIGAGDQIGRFQLEEELGRGGHGVVFAAFDPRLGRRVALKVARPEILIDGDMKARFLREAQAAGRLRHPNVVVVHEVGDDGPLCYIASDYCQGPSLSAWLKETSTLPNTRKAAELIAALADGVDTAHQAGVLHRDIKPSNVLLEPRSKQESLAELDQYVPQLADFGLAKLDGADDATRTGTLLGTPAYMAPEQARGQLREIGVATDVYALGILLYELLTGTTPMRGENDADTLRRICSEEPVPPHRLRAGIPRDLEAICLKAIEKEPRRRYATAAALAEDLRRYLAGKPTLARPSPWYERVWRWSRRKPAAAALVVVSTLGLVSLTGSGWWFSVQQFRQAEIARQAQQRADVNAEQARRSESWLRHNAAAMNTRLADQALANGQTATAVDYLSQAVPAKGGADYREFGWRHLWRTAHDHSFSLSGHQGDVYCVTWSPQGDFIASGGADQTVRLWDVGAQRISATFMGHTGDVGGVSFSPDGLRLASTSEDGTVRIWNVATRGLERSLRPTENSAGLFAVEFSPDGRLLAAAGRDGTLWIWDAHSASLVGSLRGHKSSIEHLAFSGSGQLIASLGDGKTINLWNVSTMRLQAELPLGGHASRLKFMDQDRTVVAVVRYSSKVEAFDVAGAQKLPEFQAQVDGPYSLEIDSSRRRLFVDRQDGTIVIQEFGKELKERELRGHHDRVWCSALTRDGRYLATASRDQTIKVWDTIEPPAHRVVSTYHSLTDVTFRPDGKALALGGEANWGQLRDWPTLTELAILEPRVPISGDFDGDGLVDQGECRGGDWELSFASSNQPFGFHQDNREHIPLVGDWNGDGRDSIAAFCRGWWSVDFDGQGELAELTFAFGGPHTTPVVGDWNGDGCDDFGVFDTDGNWQLRFSSQSNENRPTETVKLGRRDSMPLVFDFDGNGTDDVGTLETDGSILVDLQLSGDPPEYRGRWEDCAAGTEMRLEPVSQAGNTAATAQPLVCRIPGRVVDQARDRKLLRWDSSTSVSGITYTPDGKRMAIAYESDSRIRLCEAASGREIQVLYGHLDGVQQLSFSNDGRTLASAALDGTVRLWDVDSGQARQVFADHQLTALCVTYSPDGRLLASGGGDKTIVLRDTINNQILRRFRKHRRNVRDLAFSPDGRMLASAGDDSLIMLWEVHTGKLLATLSGHSASVLALAFSPDGRNLVSGSHDRTARVWEVATGQTTVELLRHGGPVTDVSFSPDGQTLVTLSWNDRPGDSVPGELHLWSGRPVQWQSGK